ncbi:MAG: DUF4410 domain-containing protein [Rickettsia endosymbiont of Oxypoda opaca]|nr:DUF4410 domain-containing protein [Rickettsia endosymbiont of Oxypoda opaca]
MKNFIFLILMLLLSACGSTSGIRNTQKSTDLPNFSKYDCVIVNDFIDSTSKSSNNPHVISEGKKFADIIANLIKSKKLFNIVERNVDSTTTAILIDGKITKYNEGNAVMRTLIGFGAGSSQFDAKINIRDNETKQLLGTIDVNKMSWALGGAIAGTQDVKSHMNSAASKIADECAIAKKRKVKASTN